MGEVSSGLGDRREYWKRKRALELQVPFCIPQVLPPTSACCFSQDLYFAHIYSLLKRKKVGRLFVMLDQEKAFEHRLQFFL